MQTGPKIQAKIPSHTGDYVLGEGQLNVLPLMAKGLQYSAQHGTKAGVSDLIQYDTLLQNATVIIAKCNNYFITKCARSLFQNATFITNCDSTDFLFTDLSQHFEIHLVVFALHFFIHRHCEVRINCVVQSKVIHTTTTQI